MEPLISVIIPLYNVENYLERCVDSVLNQTYQNLEVILVNDGSTDRSGNICENYKHKDERVKYLKQQNAGQSAARNKGIDTATGAFISFIDSDDWIEAEMFERLIKLSIENNLQIVECNSISSIEEVNGKIITNSEEFIIENKLEAIERIIDNELFAVWRRLYCKKLIQGIYFIENKVYEDVSFTMDVLLKVERLGHLHSNFYHYFVERSDSTMRSAYSLTKLNSIDIGYNLVLDTKGLNENIKRKANTFLINFLIKHYNQLFLHKEFDTDFKHRAKIKDEISKHLAFSKKNRYGELVKAMPFWAYNIFLKINLLRINFQNRFL